MEKLITAKEVAEILGISEKTVLGKHKKLGLPYYKVGWLLKFRASEIEEWLQNRHSKNVPVPRVVKHIRV